jgi:hypothetical protein
MTASELRRHPSSEVVSAVANTTAYSIELCLLEAARARLPPVT